MFDDWVPKKLLVDLQVDDRTNLEVFKSTTNGKPAEGEQAMPEAAAESESEPELDQNLLNQVMQMGIPENPAKHALFNTGNNSADMAVTWYFENMENPAIQERLVVKKDNGAKKADAGPPRDLIEMMMSMGLPEKKSIKALKECDNNVERAIDWAFSHDDVEEEPEDSVMADEDAGESPDTEYASKSGGVYNLQSFITHLGSSIHCGHYVAHILKPEDSSTSSKEWIYFNDDKVCKTSEPPVGKGYLYLLARE